MSMVDLSFYVQGTTLALDHGYALYSAVSRLLGPDGHEGNGLGIHPIRGQPVDGERLLLSGASRLRIRTPVELIPRLLVLSGQRLDVGGHMIRLGVPQTYALEPATVLSSRLVTIKGFDEPESFSRAVQRQLDTMDVKGKPVIPRRTIGPYAGEPTRRVLRIKDKTIVGFALIVAELTAEESLILQERGLGGRRHMGCGVFMPSRNREAGNEP